MQGGCQREGREHQELPGTGVVGGLRAGEMQQGTPLTFMKRSFSSLSMMTGSKTERDQEEVEETYKTLPKNPFPKSNRGLITLPSPEVPENTFHLGEEWKTVGMPTPDLSPQSQQKGASQTS